MLGILSIHCVCGGLQAGVVPQLSGLARHLTVKAQHSTAGWDLNEATKCRARATLGARGNVQASPECRSGEQLSGGGAGC